MSGTNWASEPSSELGWQGNDIDWEVRQSDGVFIADAYYRDIHLATVRAKSRLILNWRIRRETRRLKRKHSALVALLRSRGFEVVEEER